jgi:hypothetical protein
MLYSVYGLSLEANVSIPGLVTFVACETIPDLRVRLGAMPGWLEDVPDVLQPICYFSPNHDEHGQPLLTVHRVRDGEYLRLTYADRTEFLIDRAGTRIWSTWPKTFSLEDTAVYLLGPIIGLALRLRGTICLHASAITIDGQAIAFAGPPGAGKSTLAAAFAELGYGVLSEDVVAVTDHQRDFSVQPGYPHVRLWPTSAEILYGCREALPALTPTWDKRHLDLTGQGYRFESRPLPLTAVYVLGPRCTDPTAPCVEEMSGREALVECIANTYVNYLLDAPMRRHEFDVLSRLVARVPVRQVTPHADPSRLSGLCEAILADSKAICV